MAEPDPSDPLPTQPWTGPADPTVRMPQDGTPAPTAPGARAGGWQAPEPEQLQPSFPQYEIQSVLGRGGMGAVYKGWQKSLRRFVAIKILPPGLDDQGANFAERFQREAQAMARFSHPGIVSVFDAGETSDGLLYFVMEYIEGTDVQKMVRENGPLPPEHALAITAHVCDALAYAHKRGVIHRDIKPANIMVDAEGQVKVADFGLAKVATDDSAALVTGSHVSMGTMDFMAPEALYGMGNVDHRADLYAVGVMLYQMLTGEVPRGLFEMPSKRREGIDPRFDEIVKHAMQKDPEKRYASATEIRTDLDKILSEPVPHRSAVEQAPPPAVPPQASVKAEARPTKAAAVAKKPTASRGGKRWVWLTSGIAAALLVFAGGAAFFHDRAGAPSDEIERIKQMVPPLDVTPAAALAPGAIRLWDAPEKLPKQEGVSWENGVVRLADTARLPVPMLRDVILRASIRANPEARDTRLGLRRNAEKSEYGLTLNISQGVAVLHWIGAASKQSLRTWKLPRNYHPDEWVRLELRAVGEDLTVVLDGKVLGTVRDDRVAGPGYLSLHAIADGYFRDISYVPLDKPTAIPPPAASPLQTIDLLALTDPAKDSLMPGAMGKANAWEKSGGVLRYHSDGSFGSIVAPVAIDARSYEIEIAFARVGGGNSQLNLGLPTSPENFVPFVLLAPSMKLVRAAAGPEWPTTLPDRGRIALRYDAGAAKEPAHLILRFDGRVIADVRENVLLWQKAMDPHPEFPGQSMPSIFSVRDSFEFTAWTLRVFEGEAKPLRATAPAAKVETPGNATKDAPFVNTLGMKFVPVPGTKVLFSIWDTRVQDYEKYAAAKPGVDGSWKTQERGGVPVGREAYHPVVGVSWEDAQAFCVWLTEKETAEGKLTKGAKYRLPTGAEWSTAVGLPPEQGATPDEKRGKNAVDFPWGKEWPPTKKVGNYADDSFHAKFPNANFGRVDGYDDGYVTTSPVGAFPSNAYGLYDMGGNVWQWCEDWLNERHSQRVARGASYNAGERKLLLSSFRAEDAPERRKNDCGFRPVLEPAPSPDAVSSSSDPQAPQSANPAAATKHTPFVNTLGMKFVPVPGTKVLFSIWDTRVQDYAEYSKAQEAAEKKMDGAWKIQNKDGVPVGRESDHPVVGVNWEDAQAFCKWLTEKETAAGALSKGARYRLPTDAEWSTAVGLPPEQGATPEEKNGNSKPDFPWGPEWPPKGKVGNYADESFHANFPAKKNEPGNRIDNMQWLEGYEDGYGMTSPVGRFPANAFGLYDMGGNAWQWCEDWWNAEQKDGVLRGASWLNGSRNYLRSSSRYHITRTYRYSDYGFRCVLEPAPFAATPGTAPEAGK